MELSQKSFERILKWEGNSTENVKGDAGGLTNSGITLKWYNANCKAILGISPNIEHFHNLSSAELYKFYNERFWKGTDAHLITDIRVADLIVDFRITSKNAIRCVQVLLNDEYKANLATDNLYGPSTLAAINAACAQNAEIFYLKLKLARIDYYNEVAYADLLRHPKERNILKTFNSDIKFLIGWVRRAVSV